MVIKINPSVYESNQVNDPIYHAWLSTSNERDILENVLKERFSEWQIQNPLSMIEWGCGLGSAAKRFMKVLKTQNVDFSYLGIDPFSDQLRRFREDVSDMDNIQLEQGSFQTFTPTKRYNLAFAIHSLYYAPNFDETLQKISDYSDKLFIVHHGLYGIHQIHSKFPNLVRKVRNEISTHEDICDSLDRLGINYNLAVYPTESNIESIQDSNNSVGKDLIRFFLDDKNVSENDMVEVSKYLQSFGPTMRHDMAVIITNNK